MTSSPGPWVARWLSTPRFDVYVAACGGDRQRALALYEWNTRVAAELMHDLAHLEIGLRNAYDRALQRSGTPHWSLVPARLFPVAMATARNKVRFDRNRKSRDILTAAAGEALAGGVRAARAAYRANWGVTPGSSGAPSFVVPTSPPPGKIIAEMPFGFWRYLTSSANEKTIWVPYLHTAFPARTRRQRVDELVAGLHRIRNRAAHHEPLLRADPRTRVLTLSTRALEASHRDLLDLAGLLSGELKDFIRAHSAVPGCLTAQP